jgi:hypothetical protein
MTKPFYMCRVDWDMLMGSCKSDIIQNDPISLFHSPQDVIEYCNSTICGVVKVEVKYILDAIPQAIDYPRKEMGYKSEGAKDGDQ